MKLRAIEVEGTKGFATIRMSFDCKRFKVDYGMVDRTDAPTEFYESSDDALWNLADAVVLRLENKKTKVVDGLVEGVDHAGVLHDWLEHML